MSILCQNRSSRWQDIQNGLQFIQSTLPFPGNQEQYEVFILDLVSNLFGEGNDIFNEGEWTRAIEMYTEALSIAEYANSEDITVSTVLLEKLYANRAAAYLNIVPGLHDEALADCENALQLNEGNHRALYRKARALKELGRHKEAYDAVAKCSLAVPQDPSVIQLTQDLAKLLGLKIRKAYVRSKPALNVLSGSSYSGASNEKSHGSTSVEDIEMEVNPVPMDNSGSALPNTGPVMVMKVHPSQNERIDAESPSVCIIPSVSPVEVHTPEPVHVPMPTPISKPMPLPTLVNGARASPTQSYHVPMQESRLDFDAEIIGDDLDDLLDQAGNVPTDSPMVIPTMKGPIPLPTSAPSNLPPHFHMPSHVNHFMHMLPRCTVNLPPPYHEPQAGAYSLGLDTFGVSSPLDSLDSLSLSEHQTGYGQHPFMQLSSDKPMGMALGMPDVTPAPPAVDLTNNPLAETHEFKQACSNCYVKTGHGVLDFTLYSKDHKCKKDILLGRIKNQLEKSWKPIRPRPTKSQYVGPYYICKDVSMGEVCRYPGHCTFAYCQEEIDVWSLERKGFICRDLLFDPFGSSSKMHLTVPKILQEHHGIFMFLCGVCFDHKPRIISKTNKDDPSLCSHSVTKHAFEEHKCLVHVLKENTVCYSKIRPYSPQNQMDICRHEVRYGCVREDECFYAHSLIELKVWLMQHQLGITPENIVQEANRFWNTEASSQGTPQFPTTLKKFGPPNLKMQFVCGQCWRNGQLSEADKNKKYCTAKARHSWSKDKRVVLVSSIERKKWTSIRPLPTKKPIPSQFEICMHVSAGKKCQYIGNCTFAHSTEEKDLWTYMKDNNIVDMEQLYEHWLQSQKPGWSEEASNSAVKDNTKHIHMPTDYAEEVAGNHCWLCGKNSNSDKQWQQHITSEKHKEKVFNSEDDQNCWQYRFPTGTFRVCERYLKGTCTEEETCKLAHGNEELKEWKERREFLLMKLAKARKDHLIAPNDNDFGKYSFLLKDIN
ncbi:zinc finger CCCH domain-containing protein 7A isoform X2 [Esox lucius]|uniref:zinc finger CCCH domain-containing protein 7A isoform X2 n=1 Tax=Esox lucius TaxID=8010 RepID=UPI0005772978|nr:zinc finger CCCH domain-containing protein 7A isoform X2 [Esox lucius]